METGEGGAQLCAIFDGWFLDVGAWQTTKQGCRFACEHSPVAALAIGQRLRTRDASGGEMGHQGQIEIELGGRQVLEYREYAAHATGGHKIIGVLHTGGNAGKV